MLRNGFTILQHSVGITKYSPVFLFFHPFKVLAYFNSVLFYRFYVVLFLITLPISTPEIYDTTCAIAFLANRRRLFFVVNGVANL